MYVPDAMHLGHEGTQFRQLLCIHVSHKPLLIGLTAFMLPSLTVFIYYLPLPLQRQRVRSHPG
ncbi:hypothetical protein SPM24T3_00405 [Serratia sp. M24T3]|nr:hypothetical protein SPM24T3_00405 [Serratia sp. M24T3]